MIQIFKITSFLLISVATIGANSATVEITDSSGETTQTQCHSLLDSGITVGDFEFPAAETNSNGDRFVRFESFDDAIHFMDAGHIATQNNLQARAIYLVPLLNGILELNKLRGR